MSGGCAPAHGSVVHDVVVVEGGEVDELDGDRCLDDLVAVRFAEAGGEQHEVRTGPFPAGGEQVLRRGVGKLPGLIRDLVEAAFDGFELSRDVGRELGVGADERHRGG